MNFEIKKMEDMGNVSEEQLEQSAIQLEMRMQEYADKIEKGDLTPQEKQALDNNKKLNDVLMNKDIFEMTSEEFRSILGK
ncbi:MAG: hypothetical protein VZS44_11715 [Bacilli bacterium]|nr:hypothetical protein [Bacilli bacterium]